jgi:hypothetical protein
VPARCTSHKGGGGEVCTCLRDVQVIRGGGEVCTCLRDVQVIRGGGRCARACVMYKSSGEGGRVHVPA